jgi:hypothetical protein
MDVPRILNVLVRLSGTGALLLGVGFWLGYAFNLIQLHIGLGIALVVLLWTLAWVTWRRTARIGLVAFAAVWGVVSWVLGVTQNQILPGSLHWVVQMAHLAVGGICIALGNLLAASAVRGPVGTPTLSP